MGVLSNAVWYAAACDRHYGKNSQIETSVQLRPALQSIYD